MALLGRVVVRTGSDPGGSGLDHGGLVRGEEAVLALIQLWLGLR
jgi:hypothetical protein